MSEWILLSKYSRFVRDNPTGNEGTGRNFITTDVWFPRSNPDICRAHSYRDLARTIISWSSLMIRQDPKAHPEPKTEEKLIRAKPPLFRKGGDIAIMNSQGRHPNGDRFEAAHYIYLGIPRAHFDLNHTAKNLMYGVTEMLKLYRLPMERIHIRRV